MDATQGWLIHCPTDAETANLIALVVGLRAEAVDAFVFRLAPCRSGMSGSAAADLFALAREEFDHAVRTGLIRHWRPLADAERLHLPRARAKTAAHPMAPMPARATARITRAA